MEEIQMPDYENAIEIKDLTKKYDGFTLDSISFEHFSILWYQKNFRASFSLS